MSSRLVTTPWFTKNLAGGCMSKSSSSGPDPPDPGRGMGGPGDGSAGRGPRRCRFGGEFGSRGGIRGSAAYDPAVLLAVDVGNTNVTIGSFRNGSLVAVRRASTPRAGTADELELLVEGLLRLDDAAFADVSAVVAASVVPAVSAALEAVTARRDRPLLLAGAGTVPLPIRVDRPGEVGPDRLINAFAAARLHGAPAIVVDLGTATTFDCVARDGAFVGGAIAPGVELGLSALAGGTARLPRVELRTPERAIGRDTAAAIQSGTVLGHVAMVQGLLGRVRRELGGRRRRCPAARST